MVLVHLLVARVSDAGSLQHTLTQNQRTYHDLMRSMEIIKADVDQRSSALVATYPVA